MNYYIDSQLRLTCSTTILFIQTQTKQIITLKSIRLQILKQCIIFINNKKKNMNNFKLKD